MEIMHILGFPFPRHPARTARAESTTRRLNGALAALEFARGQLGPSERAIHLSMCRVEAQVRSLLRDAAGASRISSDEPLWVNDGTATR